MKTVFVSGCFQMLHPGHLAFLRWAASLGDCLIVSVAADETLRAYKGAALQSETDRKLMLSALRAVNIVMVSPVNAEQPWADCLPLLDANRPQVWALGPDDAHAAEKRAWATERGIAVVQQDAPKPYSTTALIERAQEIRGGYLVPRCFENAMLDSKSGVGAFSSIESKKAVERRPSPVEAPVG